MYGINYNNIVWLLIKIYKNMIIYIRVENNRTSITTLNTILAIIIICRL